MNAPAKTLPGTIPGLLREGSPVLIPHLGEHAWTVLFVEESHQGPFIHVGRKSTSRLVPLMTEEPANKVLLSLEDSTGFHHALCWLAQSAGVPLRNLVWFYAPDVARWELAHCAGMCVQPLIRFVVPMPVDEVEALRLACLQKAGL